MSAHNLKIVVKDGNIPEIVLEDCRGVICEGTPDYLHLIEPSIRNRARQGHCHALDLARDIGYEAVKWPDGQFEIDLSDLKVDMDWSDPEESWIVVSEGD